MSAEQEQALTEKMARIGYESYEVLPGMEGVLMLHVQEKLIGGALYALSLSDGQLKLLIDETVAIPGD